MSFIKKYKYYNFIIILSLSIGVIRWSMLERSFPLFSKIELKFDEFINLDDFKIVVEDSSYPIIDARDYSSYQDGYIGNAINVDIDLLYELDEDMLNNIQNIINNYGYSDNVLKIDDLQEVYEIIDTNEDNQKVIVYCWSPTCDRAEDLISVLIDTSEYFGQFGKYFSKNDFSIYKGGWDEWDSIYNR